MLIPKPPRSSRRAAMNEASTVRPEGRWRVLRPLAWWAMLVAVLFLIRTHERLSERTFLRFGPTLAGRQVNYEASATLDGHRFENGEHLSKIGRASCRER